MTARRAGRVGPAAVLAGLAGLLAGCVSVPTAGPVEQVAPRGAETDVLVQVIPSGPLVGATPTEIVRGFLTAMQAFPVSTEVARQFLTPQAAQRWDPGQRTVVYTASSVADVRTDRRRSQVGLRTAEEAELDARGSYRAAPTGNPLRQSVDLVRTDAGWRVADAPDALLLSSSFFQEYFRPFDLYFFNPTGAALVADPVWLPLGDQLTTQLAEGLLAGPTRWLGSQAVTTVSARADVQVSAPLGADGVVDVKLTEAVSGLSATQRERLSAQLVWTLSQASGVEGVAVNAAGAPLAVPGADRVQTTSSWQDYDPSDPAGLGARNQLYGLRRGHVVAIDTDPADTESRRRLTGWWGSAGRSVSDISVESTLERIAGVDRARRVLQVAPYAASRRAVATWYATDGTLLHPQWDRTGQLWVLDREPGAVGGNVVVVDDGEPERVRADLPSGADVRTYALSPDGARVALLVDRWSGPWRGGIRRAPARGDVLVIARVVRAPDGRTVRRLDQPYGVPVRQAGFGDLAAPAWGAPTSLSVLGRIADEPAQVYRVPIDGSPISGGILSGEAVLGPVGAVDLTASGVTGAGTVVADGAGRLFAPDSQGEWAQFATGVRDPRYPD